MSVLNMFGETRFTLYEISKFIRAKNVLYSLATVTSRDDDCLAIPENNFFFSFQNYFGDSYDNIIRQASEWVLKVVRTEDWDPSIYGNQGRITKEYYKEIDPQLILVKDNKFAGVISYIQDFDFYKVVYKLIEDYNNEPMFCWSNSGFGSSDHDMMYTEKYYLTKQDYQK